MKKVITLLFIILVFTSVSCSQSGNKNALSTQSVPKTATVILQKPIVNVYVENSGSMFGYISTGNDFDRSISSLLTSITVSDYSDSINLFYINSKVFKQNVNISNFIRNTNNHNAANWPGDLTRTDMCTLFDMVTLSVNKNAISIFVSDCIFSPGNEVATKFLGAEKDCITLTINQKLESQDLAFVL